MERLVKVIREGEKQIGVENEPFLLAESQTKTVPLNMANGDQIVSPDAGKLLSQVTIEKPETLIPANIVKDINVGGVVGTFEGQSLEPLDNPAREYHVVIGKEYYDDQGVAHVGTHSHPHLTNPAGAAQIVQGYDAINDDNFRVVGSLNPNAFEFPLLNVYHLAVTVGANSVNTVQKAKDYLYSLIGITETNRLFAVALRATSGFVNTEVGRIVQYPNSNNWTIALYNTSSSTKWTAGSMSSEAVLQVGRTYDIYYWQVPANVPT